MTRKAILYIAVSLDGFIADPYGGVDWLGGEGREKESDYGYAEFLDRIDTVVLGSITYKQITTVLSPGHWPYAGKTAYVFTSQWLPSDPNVEFVDGDAAERLRQWKDQPGKHIWICGGANLANRLIRADLIDEYQLFIMPIVLGSGIRLFADDNSSIELTLRKCTTCDGVIHAVYRRRTGTSPQ